MTLLKLRKPLQTAIFAIALGLLFLAPDTARATPVEMSGWQDYWRSTSSAYYNQSAVYMSGRVRRLGSGNYWNSGWYRSEIIAHLDTSIWSRTGSLSHEFFGAIYYNGNGGYMLRTRGLKPLYIGEYYYNVRSKGPLRQIRRSLYPSILIAGKTDSGWFTFDQYNFIDIRRF